MLLLNLESLADTDAASVAGAASAFLLLGTLVYFIATEIYRLNIRLRTLPGPTGLPIVGNFYQLNPDPAETLHQWGKRYGGVYQIMLGVRPVVVFNSMQAARDVFVGQGHSLIDKPKLHTFHSVLSSLASSIGTTAWNESTKRRRKVAASAMNRPGVASYLPIIDELTKDLISQLLELGQDGQVAIDPKLIISKAIVDLTMAVNYGARLPADDALLNEIVDVEDGLSRVKTPLGSPQDFIPILRWLPFNKLSARAREINRRRLVYLRRFEREMAQRIEKGVDDPCIQGTCLKNPDETLDEVDLMSISMSMVRISR
jgi:3-hydroxyphenylacetate 6-hydroxylase